MWGPPVSLPLSALGPPVSAPSLRGCHAPCRALKALSGPCVFVPIATRLPTTPPPTAGVQTSLSERATAVVLPPPRQSPLSCACPRRRPHLAVYAADAAIYPEQMPLSPTPPGKPWCRRLRRAAVPSARHRLYRELGRAAVHAPVRPRRALPRTASRAPVTSPPQSTCAVRRTAARTTSCALMPRRVHARAGLS
jgi:hypothetical protein